MATVLFLLCISSRVNLVIHSYKKIIYLSSIFRITNIKLSIIFLLLFKSSFSRVYIFSHIKYLYFHYICNLH